MRLIVGRKLGPLYVGVSQRLPNLEKHHRYFAAGFAAGFLAVPIGLVAYAMLHAPLTALINSLGK